MNAAIAKSQSEHTILLVADLADEASEEDIRSLFGQYGDVSAVRLVPGAPQSRMNGRCYVTLGRRSAEEAIGSLNGKAFKGSILRVSESRDQPDAHSEPRRATGGEQQVKYGRMHYEIDSIEKATMPAGTEGDDWYRYVLTSGTSQITGFHRGSRAEVKEYASHCVEEFNQRSASGKSARTMAPPKKKS